ncbi:MAG TPA: hypothetical protein VFR68_12305 [Candidatus Dormibacteraeota bacterium]|nr:hypothetical protein [Candidatus Dormibacteraeota bacterium]
MDQDTKAKVRVLVVDDHGAGRQGLRNIVVLSLRDDFDSRRRVLDTGAAAFVSKHDGTERLLQVIRRVGTETSGQVPAKRSDTLWSGGNT